MIRRVGCLPGRRKITRRIMKLGDPVGGGGGPVATSFEMDVVALPVAVQTVVAAVVAAGVALVLGYFGVRVGFKFVKSLLARLSHAA